MRSNGNGPARGLRPVTPAELKDPGLRRQIRSEKSARRTLHRSHWWYPVVAVLVAPTLLLAALKLDQNLSQKLVWPTAGAQFIEIGSSDPDDRSIDTMVIVAGGLNRKSGTAMAAALAPSLGGARVRLISLQYGSGIFDADTYAKFDALYVKFAPERLVFVGGSMGGDVVLGLAAHIQRGLDDLDEETRPNLSIDAIYLDCSPLSTDDVRDSARTRADLLTGLTEIVGTDGGAVTRIVAEMLVQRHQWSAGFGTSFWISGPDFTYKLNEILDEKVNRTGVSTALVKSQYSFIRRFDAPAALESLAPTTRLVYFLPADRSADTTIKVGQVEETLTELTTELGLPLTVVAIEGGSHNSAVRDAEQYNTAIAALEVID